MTVKFNRYILTKSVPIGGFQEASFMFRCYANCGFMESLWVLSGKSKNID